MTRPRHPRGRALLGVAVMAVLWVAGLEIGGLGTGLLFLAPAFVLLLPLLAGRYPGELKLTAAARPWTRRAAVVVLRPSRPAALLAPRGGLLVGCSLAGRAPPR